MSGLAFSSDSIAATSSQLRFSDRKLFTLAVDQFRFEFRRNLQRDDKMLQFGEPQV
jgi:hypothetical protein